MRTVDGVGFSLGPGEWAGVVGANGSGKTSMLRAVAGRLEAYAGAIIVDSQDRTGDRGWRARHFGFAPDISSFPDMLTGSELFSIITPDWEKTTGVGCSARLRQALDFDRFIERRIGELSAGMKQRLAIFSAFLSMPQLIILDEPFNWLDPVCAYDTKEALRELAGEGLTIITALHEMSTLVGYCSSGLLLADGRIGRRLDSAEIETGRRDYSAFEARMIQGLRPVASSTTG